ncbi:hypothetical protein BCON_0400g00060 [Botryotinia convoluta]|uniref:Uncharacterized protein n=1 Tax=Botryotinia convoluta TaxID=54673 RepID=A0A4Z1H8H7_9HELO|nr:hypothetical protein BCON_0400g00060 [Botryotinia convoluta]
MKTQSFSTRSPMASSKIASHKDKSQNITPKTPPNTRMLSPPRAPRQRRFLRSAVTSQSNGTFRTPNNFEDTSNFRLYSPTPLRGQDRRNTRSRSPPRDRAPKYRNRFPVNSRLFGGRSVEGELLGPLLTESIEQDTVMDNEQPSNPYNINERFQRMLSLADTERKEQATRSRLSGLPNNKSLHTKSKEIDSNSSKTPSKDLSDEEHRF